MWRPMRGLTFEIGGVLFRVEAMVGIQDRHVLPARAALSTLEEVFLCLWLEASRTGCMGLTYIDPFVLRLCSQLTNRCSMNPNQSGRFYFLRPDSCDKKDQRNPKP